ncbi:MAG: hypothetical protein AAFV85_26780 [Cyanobacteria bacterium J06634_6]
MENQDTQAIQTIDTHPHTRKTIGMETGSTPKTVRSWIKKAGVTGAQIQNVERFTDEQRDLILSYQSKPKAQEIIEPEIIEPGAIELASQSHAAPAMPLMSFNLEPVQIDLPSLDTSALAAQTEQLEQSAQQGANAIASYFAARFDVGLANIAAKQDNLLKGIEAQALNGAARSVSGQQAKPGK